MAILRHSRLPLETGTLVKIWHGSRGHDYIVTSYDVQNKKLGLIRATCINNDGSIHKARLRSAKLNLMIDVVGGAVSEWNIGKVAPKVSRVLGTRVLNPEALETFIRTTCGLRLHRALKVSDGVYAGLDRSEDARSANIYS